LGMYLFVFKCHFRARNPLLKNPELRNIKKEWASVNRYEPKCCMNNMSKL
jgi:hypothetical protein